MQATDQTDWIPLYAKHAGMQFIKCPAHTLQKFKFFPGEGAGENQTDKLPANSLVIVNERIRNILYPH